MLPAVRSILRLILEYVAPADLARTELSTARVGIVATRQTFVAPNASRTATPRHSMDNPPLLTRRYAEQSPVHIHQSIEGRTIGMIHRARSGCWKEAWRSQIMWLSDGWTAGTWCQSLCSSHGKIYHYLVHNILAVVLSLHLAPASR